MYVQMYKYMNVHMYSMYACIHVRTYVCTVRTYICMYVHRLKFCLCACPCNLVAKIQSCL